MKTTLLLISLFVLASCQSKPEVSTGALRQRFERAWVEERFVDAIIALDEIILRDEYDDVAYMNRGVTKAKLGRLKEAIVDFDKVIELQPGYSHKDRVHPVVMAYQNRAVANLELGNLEEAHRNWQSGLEIAIENDDAVWIERIENMKSLHPLPESTPAPPP